MSEANLVDDWVSIKEQIKSLEEKLEQLRNISGKMMDKNGTNKVCGRKYDIVKSETDFTTLSKADLPLDITKRYSKTSKRVMYRVVLKK
jgi:hypothetical protein